MGEILERVSPDSPDLNFENHCKVYRFFANCITGGAVLDVGSGNGYGAEILASSDLESYVGVDYSEDSVAYARENYGEKGTFQQMDAHALEFQDQRFDWVISSENLEHLADPRKALLEKARVLKPSGFALIGTPNKEMFSAGEQGSPNPFHVDEFYYTQLLDLVLGAFQKVLIFENTLEPESIIGKQMLNERLASGKHGVVHNSSTSVHFMGRAWNLSSLENTHSFMVIAGDPRPSL
ncbi:MAG: class I SAM-dependent methyltransferase [Opitutales bacterium]